MFDSPNRDALARPFRVVSIAHVAREGGWALDARQSHATPVLYWFASGQGRIEIDGQVRGYTAHNAIFLPSGTRHACEVRPRCQGTAVFFGGLPELPQLDRVLHLRLHRMQKQTELNALLDALLREAEGAAPYRDEIIYHQAVLTLLWLARAAEEQAAEAAPPQSPATAEAPSGSGHPAAGEAGTSEKAPAATALSKAGTDDGEHTPTTAEGSGGQADGAARSTHAAERLPAFRRKAPAR